MKKLTFIKAGLVALAALTPASFAQQHEHHVEVKREVIRKPGAHHEEQVCPHCGRGGETRVEGYGHGMPGKRPILREEARVFKFQRPGGPERDIMIRRSPAPPVPPPPGGSGYGGGGGGVFRREFRGPEDGPQPQLRPFERGERVEHLREAIRHLREGGFPEIAERLEQQAARMREELGREQAQRKGGSPEAFERLEKERDELRNELRKLRRELQEHGPAKEKRVESEREKE